MLSTSPPGGKGSFYDPDDLDSFFIIDGDLCCYLIPIEAVAGLGTISLSAHEQYRVPNVPSTAWPGCTTGAGAGAVDGGGAERE